MPVLVRLVLIASAVAIFSASQISRTAVSEQSETTAADSRTLQASAGESAPKPVTVHYYLPPDCDDETSRAVTTWNNAGSIFKYAAPTVDWGTSPPTDPYMLDQVYIREGDLETNVLMNTQWDSATSTGDGIPTIYGAIVRVNTDIILYNTENDGAFYCGSPDVLNGEEWDYESVMLHEIAHAFGFRHGGDPNCPMYPSYFKGFSRRMPCALEAQSFRDLYNPEVTPY